MWVGNRKIQNAFRSSVQKSPWKCPLGRIRKREDNIMMVLLDSPLATITRLKRLYGQGIVALIPGRESDFSVLQIVQISCRDYAYS